MNWHNQQKPTTMFQNGTQIKAVMTNEERRHLMAQLIKASLWNADEPGDPTTDEDAAKELERRVSEKAEVRFLGFGTAGASDGAVSMNNIAVYHGNDILLNVTGNTYAEAICFAAVAVAGVLWEKGDQ